MLAFGNGDGGPRDNFRGAEIVDEQAKFDATQYSFFGDTSAAEALGGLDLDGALEDDGLGDDEDYGLDGPDEVEEEDLSLAAMFARRGSADGGSPSAVPDARHSAMAAALPQNLLDSVVITTPARVRRPSSPSLRLTPGAPASSRQEEPPASTLAMRGAADLAALEAAQLQQAAAAAGGTPQAGPSPLAGGNLLQLLQPQPHFQPSPIPGAGRVVGPTSAADLEAQMLAQASPSPHPMGGQHMPGMPYPGMDPGHGYLLPPPGHMLPPGMGSLSPFPGAMQPQMDSGLHGQPQFGYGGPGMQQQPGQPMMSPYHPGQPPMGMGGPPPPPMARPPYGPPPPPHGPPQGPYGHGMPGTPPPPPPRHPGAMGPPPGHMGMGTPPPGSPFPGPPLPPMMGSPAPSFPGAGTPQGQLQPPAYGMSPHGIPGQHLPPGASPAIRPGAPPPPPPPPGQQPQQGGGPGYPSPGMPSRPPHIQRGPYGPPGGQGGQLRGAGPPRGGFDGHGHGQLPHGGGRRRGGLAMSDEEVETIMRIMYSAVHTGHPYAEDYYYQAYANAHCAGANDASFEPAVLRDLSEGVASLDPSASVRFVPIEGLGKIVYSNLRTPRVLLDFGTADKDGADTAPGAAGPDGKAKDGTKDGAPLRPLEQEPLLAARIMIEDCLNLLLDVDDIDRRFKAAMTRAARAANTAHPAPGAAGGQGGAGQGGQGGAGPLPQDAAELMQRRALLLAGIVSSFRLPHLPGGSPADAPAAGLGDRVFKRVMALPKGRKLLARTLAVLAPPLLPSSLGVSAVPNLDPLQLLWAALRNAGWLFGSSLAGQEPAAEKALAETTARVAGAASVAVSRLREPCELVACMEALALGLSQGGGAAPGMAPLVRVRRVAEEDPAARDWLGDVLVRLLQKADEMGLGSAGGAGASAATRAEGPGVAAVPEEQRKRWQDLVGGVAQVLAGHLEALGAVHAAAAAANSVEALALVHTLAAEPVVAAVAAHVDGEAMRTRLRGLVQSVL